MNRLGGAGAMRVAMAANIRHGEVAVVELDKVLAREGACAFSADLEVQR